MLSRINHLTEARREFGWRALLVIGLLALGALIWYTADIFLLAFAGILLAVFLEFLACKLAQVTPLTRGWAFAVVAVGISFLLGLAAWQAIPHISDQINGLIQSLPQAYSRLQGYLGRTPWGKELLAYLPTMIASANLVGKISAALSRAFDAVAGLVLIAVVGLYLGANPRLYERGLVKLFGETHRQRATDVFSEVAYALRWWVLGQLIPMGVLGVATTIGLSLLHVHLAFTLGLFTAFMIFIPYIGSLIALAAAELVAALQGPMLMLYVAILFIGVHSAEGYLLTPLVQKRAVYLPPALTIVAQVFMGLLLGFFGLALATPLTAAALVLVKMLYLHERPEHHD